MSQGSCLRSRSIRLDRLSEWLLLRRLPSPRHPLYSININRVVMKGGNLHTVTKTPSLLTVTLFRTHLVLLNTTIFLMEKLDKEK